MHTSHKLTKEGDVEFRWHDLNGGPGVLVLLDGKIVATMQLEVSGGLIEGLYIVRNPEKLAHLAALLK